MNNKLVNLYLNEVQFIKYERRQYTVNSEYFSYTFWPFSALFPALKKS